LSAYIQEFTKLATSLVEGKPVADAGKPPLDLLHNQVELLPGVMYDSTPLNTRFGDLIEDVQLNATAKAGDVVTARFWSASPRNDLFTEGTFALVEVLDAESGWKAVYDDDDLCLKFLWSRPLKLAGYSQATIQWEIPANVISGTYRLRHFGAAKPFLVGNLHYFDGISSPFVVS
jgi:neutral ceramidase